MKCKVIGFGSAGKRHARVLSDLGHHVEVCSSILKKEYKAFQLEDLMGTETDYVIVANESGQHKNTLHQLNDMGFEGLLMCEKPLCINEGQMSDVFEFNFKKKAVAYQMRFHPFLCRLKEMFDGKVVDAVRVVMTRYLPSMRMKSRDYRKSYSAQRAAGGGVVRDFSHELDYLLWIFGSAEKLIAQKSYNSHLEIDSEAVASIVMAMEKARHVNLFLSYLDRQPRRTISVQTDFAQIDLDLDRSVLSINGQSETLENESMDKMTQEIHRVFISEKTDSRICDFHQACMVEKLISKIDLSHEQEREMLVV